MTLSKTIFPTMSVMQQVLLVLAGTLLIAVAAQISVPLWPVPVSMQTLAILLVGFSFGARLGAITLVAYLAEGAMGLPVFAGGGSTMKLVGPTAGFLLGFVLMAWIAGYAADRGIAKNFVSTALVGIFASIVLYIPGVAWPMAIAQMAGIEGSWVGSSSDVIWQYWVQPFLIGDAVKAVLAALIVTGLWSVLRKRSA